MRNLRFKKGEKVVHRSNLKDIGITILHILSDEDSQRLRADYVATWLCGIEMAYAGFIDLELDPIQSGESDGNSICTHTSKSNSNPQQHIHCSEHHSFLQSNHSQQAQ